MLDLIQGSPEWLQARLGKVTASRICDIVAKVKNGDATSKRANYMAELIAERLTGVPTDKFKSAAMQWGTDCEPDAKRAYAAYVEFWCPEVGTVRDIGFVLHPDIDGSGASPDGLVGDDGMVETKCPLTATHLDTLLGQSIPAAYVDQMQWQMACCGRQWCDFVSYDPRLPDPMRLFVKRLPRDPKRIAELEFEVMKFISEMNTKLSSLNALYGKKDAA